MPSSMSAIACLRLPRDSLRSSPSIFSIMLFAFSAPEVLIFSPFSGILLLIKPDGLRWPPASGTGEEPSAFFQAYFFYYSMYLISVFIRLYRNIKSYYIIFSAYFYWRFKIVIPLSVPEVLIFSPFSDILLVIKLDA